MKRVNKGLATVFLLLLFIFSACGAPTTKRYEKEKFLFGTYIKIIVYTENEKLAESAFEKAFKEIERVDNRYNSKSKGSIVYNLNEQKTPVKKVELDAEGYNIFKQVTEAYNMSKGKFDITIEPLMITWGFLEESNPTRVPTDLEIKEAQKKVGYDKVKVTPEALIIEAPTESLDTGAFLKGYAIEKGKEKLIELGIEHGFISAISSISTIGKKTEGKPWKIGIQNPEKANETLGVIELDNEAMGVSGDYQTFVEIDGKKYHHILDKETGYPVSDKKMVVVVGKDALEEDLLSTALFSMTEKEIKEFMELNKNLKILVVNSDMSTYKSENFKFTN
ncbi:MAG: FAD:protein FMN transferase [Fusobacteriaceae bacterium]